MAITKFDQFDFLIDIVPRDELKPPKRQVRQNSCRWLSLPWGGFTLIVRELTKKYRISDLDMFVPLFYACLSSVAFRFLTFFLVEIER